MQNKEPSCSSEFGERITIYGYCRPRHIRSLQRNQAVVYLQLESLLSVLLSRNRLRIHWNSRIGHVRVYQAEVSSLCLSAKSKAIEDGAKHRHTNCVVADWTMTPLEQLRPHLEHLAYILPTEEAMKKPPTLPTWRRAKSSPAVVISAKAAVAKQLLPLWEKNYGNE